MMAWLIEDTRPGTAYWCGDGFTPNVECAVRLCRKEDAERVIRGLPRPDLLRAVEHGWSETEAR